MCVSVLIKQGCVLSKVLSLLHEGKEMTILLSYVSPT